MTNILYHEARPMNDSTSFTEFMSIDWEIEDVGRKLLKNSIYVEADLVVNQATGVEASVDMRIGTSKDIGYHSFWESWNVENAKVGSIQNIQHYPRYCMVVETGSGNVSTPLTPRGQAEGKQLTDEAARYTCQRQNARHATDSALVAHKKVNMCIKPKICLNSMVGDDYSFSSNGAIRISTNLARNGTALHGSHVTGTSSYELSNVRLKYITIPDNGKQGPMMMNSVVSVKQAVNSSSANLSVKVPAKSCSGVIVNYIHQADEIGLATDSYELQNFPNLDELQYLFSDTQAKYISYNVTDKDNMLKLGAEALALAGVKVKVNSFKSNANQNIVHGLDFKQNLDLSRQKFGLNLRSSSDKISTNPLNVYFHFLDTISL